MAVPRSELVKALHKVTAKCAKRCSLAIRTGWQFAFWENEGYLRQIRYLRLQWRCSVKMLGSTIFSSFGDSAKIHGFHLRCRCRMVLKTWDPIIKPWRHLKGRHKAMRAGYICVVSTEIDGLASEGWWNGGTDSDDFSFSGGTEGNVSWCLRSWEAQLFCNLRSSADSLELSSSLRKNWLGDMTLGHDWGHQGHHVQFKSQICTRVGRGTGDGSPRLNTN